MVEIKTVPLTAVGIAVVVLISFMGIQLTSTDGWYYCEAENNLKECSKLGSYGVPDAKCYGVDNVNDICTVDGVRYPWKPLSDYINLSISKETYVINSLQECEYKYYNVTEKVYVDCVDWKYDYKNCTNLLKNGTCIDWNKIYYDSTCFNGTKIVEKNHTICEPKGYNVIFKNKIVYEIKGDCCGYFNETGNKRIVCKEKVGGICNPTCQQTSNDKNVYDEYCMIYSLTEEGVVPKKVGSYDYVDDYQIEVSQIKTLKDGLVIINE